VPYGVLLSQNFFAYPDTILLQYACISEATYEFLLASEENDPSDVGFCYLLLADQTKLIQTYFKGDVMKCDCCVVPVDAASGR